MDDTHDAGATIRALRLAEGLTIRDLARRVRVSPATVSAVENGKTGVSVTRLRTFAEALNVPVAQLLTAAEPPNPRRPTPTRPHPADWRDYPPLTLDPVLAAAVDAMVETGYHGTTMRAIAQRAGMSVPGIYHHYPDKQHLLVEILDLTMTDLHRRVTAAADDASDSVERVAHIVEALALFHAHRRALAFIGASEMRSLIDANRSRIADSRNRLQRILDDAIHTASREGRTRTEDLRTAGRAITTMCTSIPQWFRDDGPATPEQIAHTYAEFALALLNATRARPNSAAPLPLS
ncbi:TetR family transcriptional regulator [Nocardia aurantia]|uniref:HTH-type transcriptional regulator BetI n=1 Tax=Nocardia aurantia TaxID=2585199 RepID=A0A7K0DJI3_9NOCA|nr:TetR family transcriptional regulator [Nocardia aurantia]MQY25970.1 HTH-type transcriptional regulator BetI [Nocardia aurantia]